ncbi:MAG: hypothetical protein PHP95_06310 [Desulfuromonadaceae bacterium]|nr:hypothetical protein [Desulfuromonadaceae bacterium]MDD2848053.1 hypothetical protein [Desulfuromonadaceae bacterium]MDD4132106.1 hypothetical protein [Desulfuromonadaceae bacterium]
MELSSILKQYNVPFTKAERDLANVLKSADTSRTDEYYEQQMKRLADARATLKSFPDKKTSDRQNKTEKASMLKERLKMLKQMIPFMSPSALKNLKAELKQIASQLASLKAEGGSSVTVSSDVATTTEPQVTVADAAVSEDAPIRAGADSGSDPEEQEQSTADSSPQSNSFDTNTQQAAKTKEVHDQDRALKETVEDLKRLYRTVRAMVQRKLHQAGDKGGPVADLPPQMQAYQVLPESGNALNIKI